MFQSIPAKFKGFQERFWEFRWCSRFFQRVPGTFQGRSMEFCWSSGVFLRIPEAFQVDQKGEPDKFAAAVTTLLASKTFDKLIFITGVIMTLVKPSENHWNSSETSLKFKACDNHAEDMGSSPTSDKLTKWVFAREAKRESQYELAQKQNTR